MDVFSEHDGGPVNDGKPVAARTHEPFVERTKFVAVIRADQVFEIPRVQE
jgi:hypothetical protein